jgi:flagellar biosynthesis/type III secretory pathway chaperone
MKTREEKQREKYERQTNTKIPFLYVLHHIDSDSKNDQLENLVPVPKRFHGLIHAAQQKIGRRFTNKYQIQKLLSRKASLKRIMASLKKVDQRRYRDKKDPRNWSPHTPKETLLPCRSRKDLIEFYQKQIENKNTTPYNVKPKTGVAMRTTEYHSPKPKRKKGTAWAKK